MKVVSIFVLFTFAGVILINNTVSAYDEVDDDSGDDLSNGHITNSGVGNWKFQTRSIPSKYILGELNESIDRDNPLETDGNSKARILKRRNFLRMTRRQSSSTLEHGKVDDKDIAKVFPDRGGNSGGGLSSGSIASSRSREA
ncbi:hypothetical protein BDF20DRAFT_835196 [Mycotypha africana]|uniref:uncharacterized protein n=1 Tax=Mycotypha africana TaxID=64632 RepID=UPI002301C082|nr:uncharacterized protein BDF20DRAFT_835196 [Mycotypha africana]KAI8979136.1 hypothetical protein BDF20DRAFT_835196 [Mycotypha africana]